MCGIFGYIGKADARENIIAGLKRLEYRGYDSWGVAVAADNQIDVSKKVGSIGNFSDIEHLPFSHIGIGHTRWATHGGVTEVNAHPHFASDKSFILAQNGIVENYQELKRELLAKGYQFETQTDTEVIVRVIEDKLKTNVGDLREAVRQAFLDLKGRNTIILLERSGRHMIAVRNGSPLVIGLGEDEIFFASDTLSFADKTSDVIYVNNYEMIECLDGKVRLSDVKSGNDLETKITKLSHDDVEINKEGFEHYMIKEIVEQKHTIREAIQYSEEELAELVKVVKAAATVYTIGAGTAGFAAGQIAFYLRKYANIHAVELKSYEVGSYKELFSEKDLLIVVSQSGETADTIEAMEFAKAKGTKTASIVNMVGSTITRISDHQFFSRSGPEICVASTKAFTAQIAWGLLLAMAVAGKYSQAVDAIYQLSANLENYFNDHLFTEIKTLAQKLLPSEHFFVLGKDQNYYVALEGALKVKEITYKHFEGFAAGELKHGVIALIEKGTPVFIVCSNDENKADMLSAAAQVKARGAYIVAIAKENNELFDTYIQTVDAGLADPIANVIPFQLLSYFLGVKLGYSPDKPRNLAKSVTVK
jgi:glucosamine--fructose-6-phosphate aminotransferase (isomerizing)